MDSSAARTVDETTARELWAINDRLKSSKQNRCGLSVDQDWGDSKKTYKASLGHIAKAGTRPIQKVIARGQLPIEGVTFQ